MYKVDEKDRVVELTGIPQSSAAVPQPIALANEMRLLLGYDVAPEEESAITEFLHPYAHCFGAPNDETLHGHPLWGRGLKHYGALEVLDSSWVRDMERMNRVHSRHDPQRFDSLRHFIFAFHDSTFECVANDVRLIAKLPNATKSDLIAELAKRLVT